MFFLDIVQTIECYTDKHQECPGYLNPEALYDERIFCGCPCHEMADNLPTSQAMQEMEKIPAAPENPTIYLSEDNLKD